MPQRRQRRPVLPLESDDSSSDSGADTDPTLRQTRKRSQIRFEPANPNRGIFSEASDLVSRLASRAGAIVGICREPMGSTESDDKNDAFRHRQALLPKTRPPDAAGFGLLTIPLWFWIPSSAKILEEAERQCFRYVKAHVKRELVRTDTGLVISTATIRGGDDVRSDINHPPVLLLHGFAGGAGIWCKNVDAIAANRVVYAIDMVGFGRSSRPVFGEDPQSIEDVFVASVEAWRRTMSIASFILVGHSLGGYVSAAYALKHPSRVEHLVLADSWGMPERPDNHIEQRGKLPGWIQALRPIVNYFNPLAALRAVGPLGAMMLRTVRPDLQSKYKDMFDDTTMTDYIYHLNAQPAPSGEAAMKSLSIPFGWAKLPMLPRLIQHLDMDVPMTLLYGERSWIDSRIGYKLQDARPHSYVDVRVVSRAGHHVYSDQSRAFNEIMVEVCTRVTDHLTSSAEDEDDGD